MTVFEIFSRALIDIEKPFQKEDFLRLCKQYGSNDEYMLNDIFNTLENQGVIQSTNEGYITGGLQ